MVGFRDHAGQAIGDVVREGCGSPRESAACRRASELWGAEGQRRSIGYRRRVTLRRAAIEIHGAVQGVGFRPFVYRLAKELGVNGWVLNDANGVFIEIDGDLDTVQDFLDRLRAEIPPVASIDSIDVDWQRAAGFTSFDIRHSDGAGEKTAVILPDLATCPECMTEVLDPADRRHGYPFTNCTNCGPRFSIIRQLPYDRPSTTMSTFVMCSECSAEYRNPLDRRFHAQPNACSVCGPTIRWQAPDSDLRAERAIDAAVAALSSGSIVAVKGLGGYQLLVDARDDRAIARLRDVKGRPDKPLAVMVSDVDAASAIVSVDEAARALLAGPESPIVLLRARRHPDVSDLIAPGSPTLGVMTATTPLHRLLLDGFGRALVATSGNVSDEPIAIDDDDARDRLGAFADGFLSHDRPIERHVDDSVAWVVGGVPRLVRRARGYAPMPVTVARPLPPILSVGAHLKNTVALSVGRNVFVSQHIGDLETPEAFGAFTRVIDDLSRMYDIEPTAIAHDLHPDYPSTRFAVERGDATGVRTIGVQHHHAHLASCLADNTTDGPALGVTWDGTGYGTDRTIWGGEFLLGDASGFRRVAHLRTFRLPGGDVAVREPRRSAVGVLHEMGVDPAPSEPGLASFTAHDIALLSQMVHAGINSPVTSSAGRLFDAAAAIAGVCATTTFEGQAAMALEAAVDPDVEGAYEMSLVEEDGRVLVDWEPMVLAMLADARSGQPASAMATRFHAGLIDAIVSVAVRIGHPTVALSGGCFQNRVLTEGAAAALSREGFEVLQHRRVPPNDGGISLGQLVIAAARIDPG